MAHPVEVDAEVAQLVAVEGLDADQRLLRQRARPLQCRQALVRLQCRCSSVGPNHTMACHTRFELQRAVYAMS